MAAQPKVFGSQRNIAGCPRQRRFDQLALKCTGGRLIVCGGARVGTGRQGDLPQHARRNMGQLDPLPILEGDDAFKQMLQLADIARPGVALEDRLDLGRQMHERAPVADT